MIEKSEKQQTADYLYPQSSKVLALYKAVEELLREGVNLTHLKVSDIAARAGIGKGTTYAYFSSKEELIVKAVVYYVYHRMQNVQNQIEQENGFQNRIYLLMDCLLGPYGLDKKMVQQVILFLFDQENGFPDRFQAEVQKCAVDLSDLTGPLMQLYQTGVAEGILEDGLNPYYIRSAFMSMLMHYAFYKQAPCGNEEDEIPSSQDIKKRLYENLVYELRLA